MEDSDSVSVARVKAGDGDAYRTLVERHSRSVFRLAYRMTGNEQDAEDVVQETFLRAYRQLHRYEARASFGTWLYRIASNYSLDLVRSRKRHPQTALEVSSGPGEESTNAVHAAAIRGVRLAMGFITNNHRRHAECLALRAIMPLMTIKGKPAVSRRLSSVRVVEGRRCRASNRSHLLERK